MGSNRRSFAKKTLVGFAIVALLGVLPSTFGWYGLYAQRYVTSLMGNPLNPKFEWYRPLERVAGGDASAIPEIGSELGPNAFDPKVADELLQYARDHDSQVLMLMHKGNLTLDYRSDGFPENGLLGAHSLTKVLPAFLIGLAIQDGFIESADQRVSAFVPEWDLPGYRDITLRHLLTMSSGVQESYNFAPGSQRMARVMGTDIVPPNLAVSVAGTPGQAFAHANPNTQILGIVLERATGKRFGDYLSDRLWQPLGAGDAYLYVDRDGGMPHTDCCMWARPQDWLRVGELLRDRGRHLGNAVVPASWIESMTTPSQAYANYGMQLWLGNEYESERRYDPSTDTFANYHSEPYLTDDLVFLDGLGQQRLYVSARYEFVLLRMGPASESWDDSYLPNLLVRYFDTQAEVS